MDKNYEHAIKYSIQNLMENVWEGLAKQKIAKKLALTAAKMETIQFIASYVQNSLGNKNSKNILKSEIDPSSIPIDNFAYGQMSRQRKWKQQCPKEQKKQRSKASLINQSRSRKLTMESGASKKEIEKASVVQKNQNGGLITLPQVEDPHYVKDAEEDKCRNYVFRMQKEEKGYSKINQERSKERSEISLRNKKIMKDLKRFTYDFEGKLFGVAAKENGHQKVISVQKKYGQQSSLNKGIRNPQQRSITNDKSKERDKNNRSFAQDDKHEPRFYDNRPQNLLDMFQDDGKISEGVKLSSQNGNEKIIKQRPRQKLSGLKQYRLSQYQSMSKNRKFMEFKRTPINSSATTIQFDKNEQSRQSRNGQPNSFKTIDVARSGQESPALPPLKNSSIKQSKFMKKFSQSSRSILNESSLTSRKSDKSFIKIDHPQLYSENFANFYQIN